MITLKSEIRDLLQKVESKERRIDEIEVRRPERSDSGNGGDGNCCDDQLAADKLCSLVGRLNEQVSCWIVNSNTVRIAVLDSIIICNTEMFTINSNVAY